MKRQNKRQNKQIWRQQRCEVHWLKFKIEANMGLFLWGVHLWELRNNRKIQIVSLESVHGRLREWLLMGMCKYRVCINFAPIPFHSKHLFNYQKFVSLLSCYKLLQLIITCCISGTLRERLHDSTVACEQALFLDLRDERSWYSNTECEGWQMRACMWGLDSWMSCVHPRTQHVTACYSSRAVNIIFLKGEMFSL